MFVFVMRMSFSTKDGQIKFSVWSICLWELLYNLAVHNISWQNYPNYPERIVEVHHDVIHIMGWFAMTSLCTSWCHSYYGMLCHDIIMHTMMWFILWDALLWHHNAHDVIHIMGWFAMTSLCTLYIGSSITL